MRAMADPAPCPCGLPQPFAHCCGRWLDSAPPLPAPDALALMRSRYSAFVLRRAHYLLATWHASTRPATIEFEPGLRWLGLQIKAHRCQHADHATVEFVARSKLGGRARRMHETSRFRREQGCWLYVDGEIAA